MAQGALIQLKGREAMKRVSPLFDGWDETLIWTSLQELKGAVWALEGMEDTSAVAICGDFVFFAGEPNQEIVKAYRRLGRGFGILTPQNEAWDRLIVREFGELAQRRERYAIAKEPDRFDKSRLEALVKAVPEGVTLRRIDGELYRRCLAIDWACDFCSQFTEQEFAAHGLGVVAMKDGEPVGGASSYIYYNGGIEIEVDTREDMRRQGIAAACCAQLILDCLARGLYPSWDAANRASVALAQKLGYHETETYIVYHVREEKDD